MKIGIAITSSFCTLNKVLKVIEDLKNNDYDLYPIVSKNIIDFDTRFGKSKDIINKYLIFLEILLFSASTAFINYLPFPYILIVISYGDLYFLLS